MQWSKPKNSFAGGDYRRRRSPPSVQVHSHVPVSPPDTPPRESTRKLGSSASTALSVGMETAVTPSPKSTTDSLIDLILPKSASSRGKTQTRHLHSSISVSEDGAEVVLCDQDAARTVRPMITPRRLNLLDSELTPSPHKGPRPGTGEGTSQDSTIATPKKISFCGLGDCHLYSPTMTATPACLGTWPCPDDDTKHMHSRIATILSVPSSDNPWLGNWQAWGLNCDVDTTHSPIRRGTDDADEVKRNVQRVLRNRAFHLNAKHQRLSSLRKDLDPFSASDPSETIQMARSRSFTGQERSPSERMNRTPAPVKRLPFLQRALQCGLVAHDSPLPVFIYNQKEDLFYDSDPEDFVSQQRCQRSSHVPNKENVVRHPRTISLRHDDQVAAVVQEMMNEQLTLILHQDTVAPTQQLRPLGVHCWIERGRQLRSGIIAPKLHWKSLHPTKSTVSMATPIPTNSYVFSSINLMDISRILPATNETMDRKRFPFCKAQHAFYVKTLDRCLLFEANSSDERDRIVKSLRLVVARLGSLLLTNNERLADEFFAIADQGHLGPGEEPYWLSSAPDT